MQPNQSAANVPRLQGKKVNLELKPDPRYEPAEQVPPPLVPYEEEAKKADYQRYLENQVKDLQTQLDNALGLTNQTRAQMEAFKAFGQKVEADSREIARAIETLYRGNPNKALQLAQAGHTFAALAEGGVTRCERAIKSLVAHRVQAFEVPNRISELVPRNRDAEQNRRELYNRFFQQRVNQFNFPDL